MVAPDSRLVQELDGVCPCVVQVHYSLQRYEVDNNVMWTSSAITVGNPRLLMGSGVGVG